MIHNSLKTNMEQESKQVRKFDAEVGKVLNLMINSIYTNKEIFIREIISNASDACDKVRYQLISDSGLIDNIQNDILKIEVVVDKKNNIIRITDNGIGMNKEELISNLGTIASSGTQKLLERYSNEQRNHMDLIGQFGVGFYSSYMVAKKVSVISAKKNGDIGYEWISNGEGEYSIERLNKKLKRGTEVTLTIKDSELEFLDTYRIKHIVKRYSDHIKFPIELRDGKNNEIINRASAIWKKNSTEVSKKEYETFYSHVSNLSGKPLIILHNKSEGVIEYTNLLFIPDLKPFDLFQPDRKTKVKLYIKRVFISEEENNVIPSYLRFLRGVVDSEDLPLNISRETLQQNRVIQKIKKSITKKVLSTLKSEAKKQSAKYDLFWSHFGEVLKEGLCESILEEKDVLLEICKFHSTSSQNAMTSLDRYIDRMSKNQESIYFLNGDSIETLRNNPQLEGFKKRNIEVLLLNSHVDNFWVNVVHEYKNKKLQSVTDEAVDLSKIVSDDVKKSTQSSIKSQNQYSTLINFIKNILGDRIKNVIISSKLVSSPACISTTKGGMNSRIEKILIEQNQINTRSARIFEINPNHSIFIKINSAIISNNNESQLNRSIIEVLYGQACLIEGSSIEEPNNFISSLDFLLEKVL